MYPFTVVDCQQRTDVWRRARLGRLCGSDAKKMLASIKSGEAADRKNLRAQLVTERLTGLAQGSDFSNAAMERGVELEPLARAMYEALTGRLVLASGFLEHPFLMAGCSLDGHVGNFEGIVELKCPNSATHITYLRSKSLPTEHLAQVTHNLWITGAKWCDFMSFDDRFPDALQRVLIRVQADTLDLAGYGAKAEAFLAECDTEVQELSAMALAVA